MGTFASTFRTFRVPLLCIFLLLVPVAGLPLMIIAWCIWAMKNWHRLEKKPYRQDEIDDSLAESLR